MRGTVEGCKAPRPRHLCRRRHLRNGAHARDREVPYAVDAGYFSLPLTARVRYPRVRPKLPGYVVTRLTHLVSIDFLSGTLIFAYIKEGCGCKDKPDRSDLVVCGQESLFMNTEMS